MKKIFTSFIAVLLTAICAVAQLPYNTNYSKDYFDSGTTTVNKKSASWDDSKKSIFGSERYNRLKLEAGGFDWNDKYVDIALSQEGVPHKLICTTSCAGAATGPNFYVATSVDNKTYTTQWSNTEGGNVEVELPKDANYVRLCYSGNLEGYYENIKVTELKYLNEPVGNFKVGEKAIKSSESSNGLTIDWCNISAIEASISGTDAAKFKVASISNNASKGNYGTAIINVTYSHNTLGTHTATLTLSGNGTSYSVTLTGTTTKKTQTITWDEQWNTPTIPIGKIVENAAKTISPLPIKYKSSNDTVIQIINDSTAFRAIAVGTATITAIQAGDDEWYEVSSKKEFTVTEKKIQTIVWNDNLTRLKTTDVTQELTAQVYIILNHETNEKKLDDKRTALLKYESGNTNVVSVSDNILTIVGEGETTLTASIEGDENYEATSVTVPVKVRQPSAGCEDELLVNEPNEVEFFQYNTNEITKDPIKINTSVGVPDKLTFQYSGKKWGLNYSGTIKVQQSTNGGSSWADIVGGEVVPTVGEYKPLTIQLSPDATHIRFVRPNGGEGYHYIKGVVVTPAQYLETSISTIIENILVGDIITKDITIKYANVKDEVLIAHNDDVKTISLSKDGLGNDCGDFGSATLSVTIVPTELGTITDNIVISDAVSKMNVTIPVTVNVRRNTQEIKWEDNLDNLQTTDNITLTASAQTEVHYTSSDSTVAYVEEDVLKINKHGHVTITAVATQDEKYEQATASKDITISAVQPTVFVWPTATAITYGQTIGESHLEGGEAEVEGYFDWWNTELNQTLVPGTHNLPVRFIPTNTNYYTSVDGTVSVTINKSAQSIIWNDSFENITVADSIVLTASAQTQVTYEVSNMELAYITENNVLYFTRGGVVSITAYASEDDYYLATETVRELTILPAKPNILVKPTATTITYGQTIGESLLEGGEASVLGTFNWLDSLAKPNAGTYWQYVRFTPDDQESFMPVDFQVEVHVNKATQTITWELTNFVMKVGDVLNLTAVATSGLEVTYTLDDDTYAEINNNVLTALQVGTVTVTASQDGTYVDEFGDEYTNYFAADPVSYDITIVAKDVNTGTDLTFPEVKATKIIRDGRLYIIRNGHTYNVNGQVVE